MQKFPIPWKIIQRGLKRYTGKGGEEVAKRMLIADQEVHQPAARQPLEKNGSEKKEGRPTAVISSRMLNQLYKRPRLRKQRVTLCLDSFISCIPFIVDSEWEKFLRKSSPAFLLDKAAYYWEETKRRIGMIQKDEEFPFKMSHIINNK
jgi:hypothetical protein